MTTQTHKQTARERWASGLFWSWNIIFLAFMVLGFAPRMLPSLLADVGAGAVPATFLIYALVLTCIPAVAVLIGLTVLRGAPTRLFALGYVVEGPLMLTLAIRFFLIRQATPGFIFILLVAGLGMATYLWQLLDPEMERGGPLAGYLRLFGLTLMALTSLYAALWIAFYALPISTYFFQWLVRTLADLGVFLRGLWSGIQELFRSGLAWLPFTILGMILLFFTATLFVLTPLAVPLLSLRAWWRNLQKLLKQHGWAWPVGLVAVTILLSGLLFVLSNRQPQHLAFALLEEPLKTTQQARALLKQQNSIRSGLLNAYLAPFRYISALGEVRHVSVLYEDIFNVTWERAFAVQRLYEGVAQPLLYDPVRHQDVSQWSDNRALSEEPREAARLYQRFFDTPIVDGERDTIVQAARTTWSGEQAEAAVQAVDEHEVHLVRQEITTVEHGDWAEVELYEVYQNLTGLNQEVVYYFNLPESAVITGVWLGDSPNRETRYTYQVAPRGAAQAVYRNETRRVVDPALVEQIGPRQYRLRVFPVPPARITWDEIGTGRISEEAPPMYMWLSFQVFAAGGNWPLPKLAEHRNIFWDNETVRLVNGSLLEASLEEWLPDSVPAGQPPTPTAHRADFPGGWSVLVEPVSGVADLALPEGLRLAVVLDRSRSMAERAELVVESLDRLNSLTPEPVDVYLTASSYRGEAPSLTSLAELNTEDILYFGGQNPGALLAQFANLRQDRQYDAILVLSDGSGYELGESQADLPAFGTPVWLVHLGDDLPLGYDDETLQAIQSSGGGVVGNLEQALERLLPGLAATPDQTGYASDSLDGYLWSVVSTEEADSSTQTLDFQTHTREDGFLAFAARRLVLAEMQRYRSELSQLPTMDRLHALAQEYSLVTPYSSMIVLVNDTQRRLLEQMEQLDDRYQREVEAIGDTTPAIQTPLTGVPEPHEWLLLILAAGMLAYYSYTRRSALAQQIR
ncbi:MAG TPA: TIGR02921 family PEP-CTERM protein [Anaerolineales bacterium]|nr:TIGR02921 family PEP-CTERM protein [Anaerolineales bacterium]